MMKTEKFQSAFRNLRLFWGCCTIIVSTSCAITPHPSVKLYLVRNGKVASRILIPENANPIVKHAADELRTYIKRITGAELAVSAVDFNSELYPIRLVVDPKRTGVSQDGFHISATADALTITGKTSAGVLYGAYHILKKHGDVRWFYPGEKGEYCPLNRNFFVPEQELTDNPSYTSRTLNLVCANVTSNMRDTWDWMARNGMKPQVQAYLRNPYLKKIPVDFQGGGHCFAGLLPSKKYFKKHPEYFALVNGKRIPQVNEKGRFKSQPCTSNPNTIRIMAEHLDAFLNKYPDVNLYVIGNNDVPIWCECDNCQALDSAEDKETHGVATRYWILVNELINRVAPKHPNVTFVGAPYQNFQYPSNEVKPDSQAEVEFCVHQKCYQHPMSDEGCRVNERYRKLLKAWSGLSKGVKTYEYTDCLPGGDVIYLPLSKNIADDLKYYYKLGVRGYKTEVAPPDGVFGKVWQNRRTKEMWPAIWPAIYTMAYFEWNVDADYGEFLEDMGSKAYGAAWPAMRKYVSELTNAMVNSPGHMIYGTPDVVLGKCLDRPNQGEKLNSLLEKALKAVADDPARLARVEMDKEYFHISWEKMYEKYKANKDLEIKGVKRSGEIVIDGKFDERDWGKSSYVSDFVLFSSKNVGAAKKKSAKQQTFVRVLHDKDNIYFAIEALEPALGKMKSSHTKRDFNLWEDNCIELFISPPGADDFEHVIFNAEGVVYDALTSGGERDLKFDSNADIKIRKLKDRYVAEVKLPVKGLKRSIKDGETWKINVARGRVLTDGTKEASSWSDGVFHGRSAWRNVAFGDEPILKNANFEDVVKKKEIPGLEVEGDVFPKYWYAKPKGKFKIVNGDAAAGNRFVRIKSPGLWFSSRFLNTSKEYRDNLRVKLKARGKGGIWMACFRYNRKPHKNVPTIVFKKIKIDSAKWIEIDGIYKCKEGKKLSLAFHISGEVDIDDISVTLEKNNDI